MSLYKGEKNAKILFIVHHFETGKQWTTFKVPIFLPLGVSWTYGWQQLLKLHFAKIVLVQRPFKWVIVLPTYIYENVLKPIPNSSNVPFWGVSWVGKNFIKFVVNKMYGLVLDIYHTPLGCYSSRTLLLTSKYSIKQEKRLSKFLKLLKELLINSAFYSIQEFMLR